MNRLKRWTSLLIAAAMTLTFCPPLEAGAEAPAPKEALAVSSGKTSPAVIGTPLQSGPALDLFRTLSSPVLSSYPDLGYTYQNPRKLSINRPAKALTTTYATYFIMGFSDPSSPLAVNGQEIARTTTDGSFGVYVGLALGENTFTFTNGNDKKTVTITRVSSFTAATTKAVTSAGPVYNDIVWNGGAATLTCTAPAGSAVSVTLAGNTYQMTQNVAAQAGVPAVFTAKVPLSGAGAGEIVKLGKATYTLSYNGQTTQYASNGNVYLVGEGARPYVTVTEYVASVFPNSTVAEGNYKSVYKEGTTEEVVETMGSYYKLKSGGYINKASVAVVETAPPNIRIDAITASQSGRVEEFTLKGAYGVPFEWSFQGNDAIITLHGNLAVPASIERVSNLFSNIAAVKLENGDLQLRFTAYDLSKLWGFDIFNRGQDAVLYFRQKPSLSPGDAPLSGISVVLDPGHGGSDTGALGIAGLSGPTEADLNLVNGFMLKYRLEQLGAKVTLTRTSDVHVTLYDRMRTAESVLPDFFISLHHNSMPETADGNKYSGVESYYYYNLGKPFGTNVVSQIAQTTGRKQRQSLYSYYTVTRMSYCPSILAELGFVVNPAEYEKLINTDEIYKTCDGIASAIMQTLR